MTNFSPDLFFDLSKFTYTKELFEGVTNVWDVFARTPAFLENFFKNTPPEQRINGTVHPSAVIKGDVYIAAGAKVEPTAYIEGPTIIGPDSIVGTAAYIRGGTITGRKCIIGHATEVKNAIFLDHAAAPHFNFVGDSIMGNDVNIGAGVILANFRLDAKPVPVNDTTTGLVKFGAILGDRVKIGCNTVTEPGTFLGQGCWVGPVNYLRRGFYEKGQKHSDLIKKF